MAAVGECLDVHAPVGHLDPLEHESAIEQCAPGIDNRDLLRNQERCGRRRQAVDAQVLEDIAAVPEPHRHMANRQRPAEISRALTLGKPLERRSDIHRH